MRRSFLLPALLLASACGGGSDAPAAEAAADPHAAHAAPAAGATTPRALPDGGLPSVLVYKTETCGCCDLWIDHLVEHGFSVDYRNVRDLMAVKRDTGVPASNASCHTALVDGLVVEGHVPADQIKRFLAERPDGVIGIAVPGMPIGSPGMEGAGAKPYDVLTIDRQGRNTVYATVDPR